MELMPVDSFTVTVIVVNVPPFRLICGGRGWVVFCDHPSVEAICVERFSYFSVYEVETVGWWLGFCGSCGCV